ncbi:MAG: restriction endonuclease subunit S [Flavobacterium sp.]|nr:restriction endonuclease subunit S [Flavobacterium sp.]
MSNRKVIINKICKLNRETIRSNNQPDYINYLDTGNITRNRINEIKKLTNGVDKFPSRAQRKVQKNTIIYSTVRPEQEHFGIIENPIDNLIVSTGFTTLDIIDDSIDAKYFYYSLTNKSITEYLNVIASNNVTSYPSLNPSDIGDLVLKIPSSKIEQQKIAKILSDLDAKIELNNRINTELEAMAKTLYDYWFVQFDFPDANGKPYKTSGGKMVWNEQLKREIPEGWEVGELKDIANITMGQSPPGESYNEEGNGMIFYQGCTDFGNRYPTIRKFTTSPTRFAKQGDILLSVRAPVGTLNISKENCCIGRGLACMNSKNDAITYLFGVMVNLKQTFDRRNASGTTFGSITKDDLFSLPVIIPNEKTVRAFQNLVFPSFEKQNKIELENIELASLRDWLLPMLMNGQVRVGDVAEELGMVAEESARYGK